MSMVYGKNTKGQAAIEFLMTYGWMLLVVLIVGALIFSFVDFGSLLPNKVDLGNDLRALETDSFASANGANYGDGKSYAIVVFTYSGARQISIDAAETGNKITSALNPAESCSLSWVKNVDTDVASSDSDGTPLNGTVASYHSGLSATTAASGTTEVLFLNGQTGVLEFDCSSINGNTGLLVNDILEGKVTVVKKNAKTDVPTPSSGPLRLSVIE